MGVALYTNNASSTLAAGINAAVTSFSVAAGQGALFPNPTGGDYFYVTLSDAASGLVIEICKCTARSTDALTVTRGSQGTTPAAFLTADKVELRPTATGFTELAALGGTNTYTGYQALAAGAVGTPSLYLSTDTTTGLYRIGANNYGFAVSGAKVLDIASTGLAVTGTLSATGQISGTNTSSYQAGFSGWGPLESNSTAGAFYVGGASASAGRGEFHYWNNSAINPALYIDNTRNSADGRIIMRTRSSGTAVQVFMATDTGAQFGNATNLGSTVWFSGQSAASGFKNWMIDQGKFANGRFSIAQANAAGGTFGSAATEAVYIASGGTSWTSASDETLKDITGDITGALAQVAQARTVRGTYKHDPDTAHSFLIAQDWQDYLPEAISVGNDGKLGLSYTETIPVAFSAIKELIAKNEALEARLAALEAK